MSPTPSNNGPSDGDYQALLKTVDASLMVPTALFTTDAMDLFDLYLSSLPQEARQHHNCTACRRFMRTYGGLVIIAHNGENIPAFWHPSKASGGYYSAAVDALFNAVNDASVTGVFLSKETVWGQPQTGPWTHLSAPFSAMFQNSTKSPSQAMAEKREEFGMVERALEEFPASVVNTAMTILEADVLYRAEKVIGPAKWLKDLHDRRAATKHELHRKNILWLAVATAPAGFCHPRSSMIGTLLEAIASGLDVEQIKRGFAKKMNPLLYQRPQAPPSAGNIAQGEKIIADMGAAASLRRRFALVEEVHAIWRPSSPAQPNTAGGGVFGHLNPKEAKAPDLIQLPNQTMTWAKFSANVLPKAKAIDFIVPSSSNNYAAILTAADFDAPPILQWDSPEKRNPFSWYVYHRGSMPQQFGLEAGKVCKVKAVTINPSQWTTDIIHHGEFAFLVLDGARDSRYKGAGNALFPEMLKAELRPVRATIEAYSAKAEIEGGGAASACGLVLNKNSGWNNVSLRVTTEDSTTTYSLDRWD